MAEALMVPVSREYVIGRRLYYQPRFRLRVRDLEFIVYSDSQKGYISSTGKSYWLLAVDDDKFYRFSVPTTSLFKAKVAVFADGYRLVLYGDKSYEHYAVFDLKGEFIARQPPPEFEFGSIEIPQSVLDDIDEWMHLKYGTGSDEYFERRHRTAH